MPRSVLARRSVVAGGERMALRSASAPTACVVLRLAARDGCGLAHDALATRRRCPGSSSSSNTQQQVVVGGLPLHHDVRCGATHHTATTATGVCLPAGVCPARSTCVGGDINSQVVTKKKNRLRFPDVLHDCTLRRGAVPLLAKLGAHPAAGGALLWHCHGNQRPPRNGDRSCVANCLPSAAEVGRLDGCAAADPAATSWLRGVHRRVPDAGGERPHSTMHRVAARRSRRELMMRPKSTHGQQHGRQHGQQHLTPASRRLIHPGSPRQTSPPYETLGDQVIHASNW